MDRELPWHSPKVGSLLGTFGGLGNLPPSKAQFLGSSWKGQEKSPVPGCGHDTAGSVHWLSVWVTQLWHQELSWAADTEQPQLLLCSWVTHGHTRESLRPAFRGVWMWKGLFTESSKCPMPGSITGDVLGSQAQVQTTSALSTGGGTSPSEIFPLQTSSGVLLLSVLSSVVLSWWKGCSWYPPVHGVMPVPQVLWCLPAGAEQCQVQKKRCSFVGSAGCSQSWPLCSKKDLSSTKILGVQSVCAFPKTGLNQLIKPTAFRNRQDAATLQGRGDVSVQPLPRQGPSTDIWTAVVPFLREMCHGFLTWGSGACEPVTKEACRVGPKRPKCPKLKKSQISSYRSPRRDQIVTLQTWKKNQVYTPLGAALCIREVFCLITRYSFLGVFFSLGKKMPVLCLSTEARNEIHLNFTSHLGVTKYAGKLEYLLVDYALELFFSHLYGSWQDRTIYWELNNDICY